MGKFKKIEQQNKTIEVVLVPFSNNGWATASGVSLTFTAAQRAADNGRPFSNLYTSFNLPTTCAQTQSYTSTWYANGMSGLNQDDVIVVSVGATTYGETMDGRTIKVRVPDIANSAYTLYSSYYEPQPFASDNSTQASYFGNPILRGNVAGQPSIASSNVAFLFNDRIKRPTLAATNTSITSWSDGWQENVIPNGYTDGSTDNFRFTDVVSSSNQPKAYAQSADLPVGIAYLDKGFYVITDPEIVGRFCFSCGTLSPGVGYPSIPGALSASTGFTQLYFSAGTSASSVHYSFEKEWVLTINVVADSGEFYVTENQTASPAESPYYGAGGYDTGMQYKTPFGQVEAIWDMSDVTSLFITKIGLYDGQDNLLAIGYPNEPIEKGKNTPVRLTLTMKY